MRWEPMGLMLLLPLLLGIYYCKAEHQKEDWPQHKPVCLAIKQAAQKGFVVEITKDTTDPNAATPEKGDKVEVHYTGTVRSSGQPTNSYLSRHD
jgi:hypothetical protein